MLYVIHELEPLLYKLDEPVQEAEAEFFLSKMQEFFIGCNFLTHLYSDSLVHAIDDLLRVVSARERHPNYIVQKLTNAGQCWKRYSEQMGQGSDGFTVYAQDPVHHVYHHLYAGLSQLVAGSRNLNVPDVLLIRLTMTLLDYACATTRERKAFPPITSAIHQTLRRVLDYSLLAKLNTRIPDAADAQDTKDLKSCCFEAWKPGT